MNEPEEFYLLSEGAPLRLATASAERSCALIVGGPANHGGGVCAHAREEHTGSLETRDVMCHGCEREGVPMSRYAGLMQVWPGRDHRFMVLTRPDRRQHSSEQERAAA